MGPLKKRGSVLLSLLLLQLRALALQRPDGGQMVGRGPREGPERDRRGSRTKTPELLLVLMQLG